MKLHLTARAPNEGARMLARWVMHRHAGNLFDASAKLVSSAIVIQRIIAGEIVPGPIVGADLMRHVGINSTAFERKASLGWFDDAPMALAA